MSESRTSTCHVLITCAPPQGTRAPSPVPSSAASDCSHLSGGSAASAAETVAGEEEETGRGVGGVGRDEVLTSGVGGEVGGAGEEEVVLMMRKHLIR